MNRLQIAVALAVLVSAATAGGCGAILSTGAPLPRDVRERSVEISVHGELLTLHLAEPQTPASAARPLVLYASGDGGWFGAAVGMFHTIGSSGFPTVGFSSKQLMDIEHKRFKPLGVAHVAEGRRLGCFGWTVGGGAPASDYRPVRERIVIS